MRLANVLTATVHTQIVTWAGMPVPNDSQFSYSSLIRVVESQPEPQPRECKYKSTIVYAAPCG